MDMAKAPRVPTHSASQIKFRDLIVPSIQSFENCEQPNSQKSNFQQSLFDIEPYRKQIGCFECGSRTKTCPGVGPHYAKIECANCGKFIKWLPKPRQSEVAS